MGAGLAVGGGRQGSVPTRLLLSLQVLEVVTLAVYGLPHPGWYVTPRAPGAAQAAPPAPWVALALAGSDAAAGGVDWAGPAPGAGVVSAVLGGVCSVARVPQVLGSGPGGALLSSSRASLSRHCHAHDPEVPGARSTPTPLRPGDWWSLGSAGPPLLAGDCPLWDLGLSLPQSTPGQWWGWGPCVALLPLFWPDRGALGRGPGHVWWGWRVLALCQSVCWSGARRDLAGTSWCREQAPEHGVGQARWHLGPGHA